MSRRTRPGVRTRACPRNSVSVAFSGTLFLHAETSVLRRYRFSSRSFPGRRRIVFADSHQGVSPKARPDLLRKASLTNRRNARLVVFLFPN